MRGITVLALLLVVIGAINWGLIGLFNFNLVMAIFGTGPVGVFFQRLIYALVGFAGVYGIWVIRRLCVAHDGVCVPGRTTPAAQT